MVRMLWFIATLDLDFTDGIAFRFNTFLARLDVSGTGSEQVYFCFNSPAIVYCSNDFAINNSGLRNP